MGRYKKASGLGDVISNITTAVGIKPCEDCNKRRAKLNKLFPFGTLELSEYEKEYLTELFNSNPAQLTKENQEVILNAYFRCYRVKPFDPCTNCSGVWKSIIKKLKKLL
jgi:hypothetical protein